MTEPVRGGERPGGAGERERPHPGGDRERPTAAQDRDAGLRGDLASLRIDRDAEEAETAPRRRRPIVLGALAALVLIGLGLGYRAAAHRIIVVQVAPAVASAEAVRGAVLSGTGYVVTGEKYIAIGVRVAGRIERYYVDEGQSVRAGDPLVALDDRDYRARLDGAAAALRSVQASLTLHELELRRARELFASRVVGRQELDERESRVAVDRATSAQLEAEIAQAKVELEYTVLRAPRDGVILAKLKEVGEIAVPGGFAGSGDLIRMANLEDLRAEVDINESDLHRIHMGQGAEVIPDAYPDHTYAARVVKLYPQVNRQKGTLKIEVRITEPDALLLPDMSVRLNFLAEAAPAAPGAAIVLVPRAALRRDDRETYVWVVRDGQAHRQAVTTGTELGDRLQVTAGLSGGEALVVGDALGIGEGAAVRVATEAVR
jgi:RND family efflux transporter MFP subunit